MDHGVSTLINLILYILFFNMEWLYLVVLAINNKAYLLTFYANVTLGNVNIRQKPSKH